MYNQRIGGMGRVGRRRKILVVGGIVGVLFLLVGSGLVNNQMFASRTASATISLPSSSSTLLPSGSASKMGTILGPNHVMHHLKVNKSKATGAAPGSTCNQDTPCQMGLSDFGCSGTCSSFNSAYLANGVLSESTFTRLFMCTAQNGFSSNACDVGNQLNAVNENVWTCNGNAVCKNDQYWTQDVLQLGQTGPLTYVADMLTNIWNFTGPGVTSIASAAITSTCSGTGSTNGGSYYSCQTGTFAVQVPFFYEAWSYTKTDPSGNAEVLFNAYITSGPSNTVVFDGQFDNVTFRSDNSASTNNDCQTAAYECYIVGGINGANLYDSLENDIVGVCCGATTSVSGIQAYLFIAEQPYIGDSFFYTPHAWSSGFDTAETSSNVMTTTSRLSSGYLVETGSDSTIEVY